MTPTEPPLTPLAEAIAHVIAAHEQGGTWVPGQELRPWHKRAACTLEAELCDSWRATLPTRRLVRRLDQMTPPVPAGEESYSFGICGGLSARNVRTARST